MDRAHRDTGERALSGEPRRVLPSGTRWIAALVSVGAFLLLGHLSSRASRSFIAAAELRASQHAAAYLTLLAPPREGSKSADFRLLSAAHALVGGSFWNGKLQVWLDGNPLLAVDPGMEGRSTVPLPGLDSVPRGAVVAWDVVPEQAGLPAKTLSGLGVAAIMMLILVGERVRALRVRRAMLWMIGTVAFICAGESIWDVVETRRAALESGLLRSRRLVEAASVSRRLPDSVVAQMTSGWVVTPMKRAEAVRERGVTWDSLGASVVVTAAREQSWQLVAPEGKGGPEGWPWMFLLMLIGAIGAIVVGALPPDEGYLTTTSGSPLTPS